MPEIARIDKASVSIIYIKNVGICILIIHFNTSFSFLSVGLFSEYLSKITISIL